MEHPAGQQYRLAVEEARRLVWRNLATIVRQTGTAALLTAGLAAIVDDVGREAAPSG